MAIRAGVKLGAAFLVVAVASSVATLSLIDRTCGVTTDAPVVRKKLSPHEELLGWPGPSKASELCLDTDADGCLEEWTLFAWRDTDRALTYDIEDEDDDGVAETLAVHVGNPSGPHAILAFTNHDRAGGFGRVDLVLLLDPDFKAGFTYKDLNSDGRFDTMIDLSTHQACILMDTAWVETQEVHFREPGPPTATIVENGETKVVEFAGSEWTLQPRE